MGCEYCDASFGSRRDEINHLLDEHDDELTSHDRDELKRERNKLQDNGNGRNHKDLMKTAGVGVLAVLLFAGIGYALMAAGYISFSLDSGATGGMGAPGSTHEHMPFTVIVNGEQIDFSQPKYQVGQTQNQHVHFEQGDGSTLHKHATGVTLGYAMESLGMKINSTCLTLDTGETYCEGDGGELTVTAGGKEVDDPASYVLQNGVGVRIEYTANKSG